MNELIRQLLALITSCAVAAGAQGNDESRAMQPRHAHAVYFTLSDHSQDARRQLVEACKRYLSRHEGTVHFSVGTIDEALARDVNVRDFDVSLYIIFENRAAHDLYQAHPRHTQFVEENQRNWAKVRVFDSSLQ